MLGPGHTAPMLQWATGSFEYHTVWIFFLARKLISDFAAWKQIPPTHCVANLSDRPQTYDTANKIWQRIKRRLGKFWISQQICPHQLSGRIYQIIAEIAVYDRTHNLSEKCPQRHRKPVWWLNNDTMDLYGGGGKAFICKGWRLLHQPDMFNKHMSWSFMEQSKNNWWKIF